MIAPFPSVVASTDGVAGVWVDMSDAFGAHATTCGGSVVVVVVGGRVVVGVGAAVVAGVVVVVGAVVVDEGVVVVVVVVVVVEVVVEGGTVVEVMSGMTEGSRCTITSACPSTIASVVWMFPAVSAIENVADLEMLELIGTLSSPAVERALIVQISDAAWLIFEIVDTLVKEKSSPSLRDKVPQSMSSLPTTL